MSTRVVTMRFDEPISAAVERMTRFGFSALPVVSASFRLVGVVSLLDVLHYREQHEAEGVEADERMHVEEIMSTGVLSMSPRANASTVAKRLRSHGELRVLPVVERGKLVGVVTLSDLLRHRGQGGRRRTRGWRMFGGRDKAADDALFALARAPRTTPAPASTTPVREVGTRQVISVGPAQPIGAAAELMLINRHTTLPVVDGRNRLVGILSEADILADPLAGRAAHATVDTVMTRTPITVDVDATVGEARALVVDQGVRTVPVIDGGLLVGVLSRSDLV